MKLFPLLILALFASENENDENDTNYGEHPILVKIEEDESANKKSKFIGVFFHKLRSKWQVMRWNKNDDKSVFNGYYDNEEIAAHASDNLARKLMENSKQKLKLNFPDDNIEVYQEKSKTSKYIGVSYEKRVSKWKVQRWSEHKNRKVHSTYYDDEKTAAHVSDNLARKLMRYNEKKLKLNFPDNYTEIFPEKDKRSKYIGVSYRCNKKVSKWKVQRWNKNENKTVFNGYYDNEETAAYASDTLARKIMESGEQKLKLNFPDDRTESYSDKNQKIEKKRKRPTD